MFAIGFEKWDLLLIRFSYEGSDRRIGYIRYCLRDELKPSRFETEDEANDVLKEILKRDINFVNDSNSKSIVDGSNIDKSKLKVFKIEE